MLTTWLSCCPIKGRKFSDVIYGRSLIVKNNIHLFLSFFLNWFKLMRSWNYSLVLNYDGFVITHLIDSACIGYERWRNQGGEGQRGHPPDLGRSINPISQGKADYAPTTLLLPHHIFRPATIPGYVQLLYNPTRIILFYYLITIEKWFFFKCNHAGNKTMFPPIEIVKPTNYFSRKKRLHRRR